MELDSVRRLKAEIDARQQQLGLLREAAIRIPQLNGLPKAKSLESVTEKTTMAIVELESEIFSMSSEFFAMAARLAKEIVQSVGGVRGRVLCLRYVSCLPFRDIAVEMKLSEARIYALHKEGKKIFNSGSTP